MRKAKSAPTAQGNVNGGIVGFFSLEMSAEQLATRILAEQTGIPSNKIRRGGIDEADFEKIKDVSIELQTLPFYVDETGGLSIGQLAARARRLKRQRGLDLMVDRLHAAAAGLEPRAHENRVQEVTEITTRLKALAKELNVPVLALSQLSRQVESREDKRPQLSDLRESGSIEQDADVVMFVFREEYYHQMRKPTEANREKFAEWLAEGERVDGKAEVIIGKQRHGPTGTVELQFDAEVTRFANLDTAHQPSFLGRPPRPALPPPRAGHNPAMALAEASARTERRGHRPETGGTLTSISPPSRRIGARWSRQLRTAECARRGQGQRLWARPRSGDRETRPRRLQDLLRRRHCRSPSRALARARGGDLCAQRVSAGGRRGLHRDRRAAGHQQRPPNLPNGTPSSPNAIGAAAQPSTSTPA